MMSHEPYRFASTQEQPYESQEGANQVPRAGTHFIVGTNAFSHETSRVAVRQTRQKSRSKPPERETTCTDSERITLCG